MIRYEIRAATLDDRNDLLELARYLDTVNLPHDEREISSLLELSEASFRQELAPPKREYVFVLRDLERGLVVGTSMILGQLGRRDAPYIYFDVHREERYSATLDRHFIHQLLTIGYSYHGPTEIGGLVVHPEHRRASDKLGLQVSYVRFLFIAMHRHAFQNEVLAELLPPLEPDGTSHLWEAVGRHFTGLSYREADRLSKRNKEFIRGLFPDGDIYTSLLDSDAQSVIGKVGPQTLGVERLLRRIGFRYAERVDPFDGGPHFIATTDEITLVRRSHKGELKTASELETSRALVAVESPERPFLRVVLAPCVLRGTHDIVVPPTVLTHFGASEGDTAWALPLE